MVRYFNWYAENVIYANDERGSMTIKRKARKVYKAIVKTDKNGKKTYHLNQPDPVISIKEYRIDENGKRVLIGDIIND